VPDRISQLQVKIFADGADRESILALSKDPLIKGFTTNPTLMRKAGVKNYESFCRDLVNAIPGRPFSFEVFSDDFEEMERQATRIAGWGPNVYVKIPITNTRTQSSSLLIHRLCKQGVKVNPT
jgi:transaldolase